MPRYVYRGGSQFFEAERDGVVVHTCGGYGDHKKIRKKEHEDEDAARYAYGREVAKYVAMGFRYNGPSQHLQAPPIDAAGSMMLVEEYFKNADERFVEELLRMRTQGATLKKLAEPWLADQRPWARRALLAYIDDGCDRPDHKALVKQLFKRAEAAGDDELMAHFLVAFDAIGRRLLVKPSKYSQEQDLRYDPAVPERLVEKGKVVVASPQFSRATRRYLARRAYRYFRHMAYRDLARYGRALRIAMPLYRDEALGTAARLLDAWGLMHALYRYSPVIRRGPRGVTLTRGKGLGELAPAPHFPAAWLNVFDDLVAMLVAAQSRTVRNWTIAWLRQHYATQLATLDFAKLKSFVTSEYDELQQLGAHLLRSVKGLETLPMSEWLELLAIENLDVLPIVCEVVEKYVTPSRLTLEQCVQLACAKTAPVAKLGLQWAKGKRVQTADDLVLIAKLAKAGVATVRSEGTAWATETIKTHPQAKPEHLRDLCDAPHADAREHALAAVAQKQELAPPSLWFALTESPYDDVRKVVIANALKWRDAAPKATLQHVWTTATLAIHRGSVVKRRVPRAIAERIAKYPEEAPQLLPILRLALRSVRPPERATAIAALARAVHANAELRALANELIPELTVTEQITS